ncbi:hypothetical protein LXL04_010974 [Taraxacum kok-saghyz]
MSPPATSVTSTIVDRQPSVDDASTSTLLYRCLPTSTSSMPALPFYTSAPTAFGFSKVNRKIGNELDSPNGLFYIFTLLFDCNLLNPISGLTSSFSSLVLMAMSIINVQWCHFFAIGDKKRFVCHIKF